MVSVCEKINGKEDDDKSSDDSTKCDKYSELPVVDFKLLLIATAFHRFF